MKRWLLGHLRLKCRSVVLSFEGDDVHQDERLVTQATSSPKYKIILSDAAFKATINSDMYLLKIARYKG